MNATLTDPATPGAPAGTPREAPTDALGGEPGGAPRPERRRQPRAGPLLRWYYDVKYRAFRRERRPHDERRGLIALQIDALSYADLRRALELGGALGDVAGLHGDHASSPAPPRAHSATRARWS